LPGSSAARPADRRQTQWGTPGKQDQGH
jgi:hypothetical protein